MTLKEAQQKIADNEYLIGTFYKNDEISEFAIIPSNGDNAGAIYSHINLDKPYDQYLNGYNDFEVIVLLDFPEKLRLHGYVTRESVDKILSKKQDS